MAFVVVDEDLVLVTVESDGSVSRAVDEGDDGRDGTLNGIRYLDDYVILPVDTNAISRVVEASAAFFPRDRVKVVISALNGGTEMELGDDIPKVLQSLS
jgi:hypothetical protein